jgi:hypothetical protein
LRGGRRLHGLRRRWCRRRCGRSRCRCRGRPSPDRLHPAANRASLVLLPLRRRHPPRGRNGPYLRLGAPRCVRNPRDDGLPRRPAGGGRLRGAAVGWSCDGSFRRPEAGGLAVERHAGLVDDRRQGRRRLLSDDGVTGPLPQPRRAGDRNRRHRDVRGDGQDDQQPSDQRLPHRPARRYTAAPPGTGSFADIVQAGALGTVVDARPTHHANLEPADIELPPAVAASRDANGVTGRHDAAAASRTATTTVFLPAALAR